MHAQNSGRFQSKVAVVTGGGAGIGAAICKRLSSEGARVVVSDIDQAAAERVATDLPDALAIKADVGDEGQVEALVASAVAWSNRIDFYVNNAAKFAFGNVLEVTNADWDSALAINLKGYAFGIKHASQAMIKQAKQAAEQPAEGTSSSPAGSTSLPGSSSGYAIVNLASTGGVIGQPDMVPYCTTKAGVFGMTRSCALDLGKHNIRVNAVVPGAVETKACLDWAAGVGMSKDDLVNFQTNHIIIQRLGKAEEVAAVVAFLLSSDASYVTGTSINVDGGYLAR